MSQDLLIPSFTRHTVLEDEKENIVLPFLPISYLVVQTGEECGRDAPGFGSPQCLKECYKRTKQPYNISLSMLPLPSLASIPGSTEVKPPRCSHWMLLVTGKVVTYPSLTTCQVWASDVSRQVCHKHFWIWQKHLESCNQQIISYFVVRIP